MGRKTDIYLRLPHDVARWLEAHPETRPGPLVENLLRRELGLPPVHLAKRENHRLRLTAEVANLTTPAHIRAILSRWLEREKRRQ